MYQVGYAKNEGTTATINITADTMDAASVTGYVVFWLTGGTAPVALFRAETFVYATKI